jgi:hypothetical protein
MKSCIYFCKNLYYDANYTATNFDSLDRMNNENANIHKNLLRNLQCTYLPFDNLSNSFQLNECHASAVNSATLTWKSLNYKSGVSVLQST